MDHLNTSLMFKIRKVVRYTFIYGISRTFIKVQGQLHQRRKYSAYPERHFPSTSEQCVALVGCGNFCFSNIAYFLRKRFGNVFAACMDRDADKAYSLSGYYRIPQWTTRFEEVLENPKVKLVYIASNHASHAEYAIQALEAGKHVYIEKPHVVNFDQLHRLVAAFQSSSGKVFVGFNRPYSRFGKIMLESLAKENGPGMYNWSVIGHAFWATCAIGWIFSSRWPSPRFSPSPSLPRVRA
jgi:predicted dehydrogenase